MKEPNEGKRGAERRLWMPVVSFLGAVALAFAGLVALNGSGESSRPMAAQDAGSGWGSQVLATVHKEVIDRAPISVANACGMGATSCFKCHNKSERGPKPNMDKSAAPWHPQHMDVNHSCDGCHKGNPRLMIEGTAHRNMVADPRTQPEKTCGSCHDKGKVVDLLKQYQGVGE